MYSFALNPYPTNNRNEFPKIVEMNPLHPQRDQFNLKSMRVCGPDPWRSTQGMPTYTVPSPEDGDFITCYQGITAPGFSRPRGQANQSLKQLALEEYNTQVVANITNLDTFDIKGAFEHEDFKPLYNNRKGYKPLSTLVKTLPSGRKYMTDAILSKY